MKIVRLDSTPYFALKVPNKRELQQVAFDYSSDIDFQYFMDLYKKCTAKPYSFLVIITTLASDSSSRFRKNLIMTIDHQISNEKLQYDINREAAEISALSSGKVSKYLTGEEILPSDQIIVIEQGNFTYPSLSKAFEKQIKTIDDQGIK